MQRLLLLFFLWLVLRERTPKQVVESCVSIKLQFNGGIENMDYYSFSDGIVFGLVISVAAVMGILNIIFFFKMWGMTNNVKEIKDTLNEWLDLEHPMLEKQEVKEQSNKIIKSP